MPIEIADDFAFRPLPAIPQATAATAAGTGNPLGRLAGLLGRWQGTGFNVIWRPHQDNGHFLQLNLTSERIQFTEIPGAIPNRGLLQKDIDMFGLTYLQDISDRNLGAGLHIEPGLWVNIPATTVPEVPPSVARLASIPHGTTIVAQGRTRRDAGPPTIAKTSIVPFGVGTDPTKPDNLIDFPERDLSQATDFRTPPAGLVGITQKLVDDPTVALRAAIKDQTILSTITLDVTTAHKPILGGGTANTAFLQGDAKGADPNANATRVTSTFWIETVRGAAGEPDFHQLQYVQNVTLDFAGISWPHITVGTLGSDSR
jgi:hypothetical protein